MVSTTLTTIAAGQPTSSANHRHSSTAIFAASTANNSNYQRATQQQPQQQQPHQQHSSSSTRNNYYYDVSTLNGAGNSNNNTKATSIAFQSAVGAALETNDQSSNPQQHYKRPTTTGFYNGKAPNSSNTVTLSPSTETVNKPDLITTTAQTLSHTKSPRNAVSTTTATITTTPSVNLTKSLLSASPPLNDQISLLFPKCRPKQHVSNNSSNHTSSQDSTTNGSEAVDEINSTETPQLIEEDILSSVELPVPAAAADTTTSSTTTSNYYRTVNIITQSPPPPSTSSVSSESLSSVTPRISTNPFLYPNLSSSTANNGDATTTNKLHEIDETNFVENDEELPVPSYQTFYYHTSSVDRREERKQKQTSNSFEMPRKRSSYVGYHHQPQQQQQLPAAQHCTQLPPHSSSSIPSVGSHHHQQLQQQQQQHQSLHNGSSTTLQRAAQPSSQSQNPFIKDNYWETRHNSTPASTVLNSPEYSNNDGDIPAVVPPSSRRAYHQQTYSSHYMPRQQQHHIRVGRSPINHYGEQYETTRRIGDNMLHPQAQQNHQQPDVMPSQQATTRYLYSSKSSIEQHVGEWDQRERRERESRERDREQREQRVGVSVTGSGGGIGEQDCIEVERERLRDICDVVPQAQPQPKQQLKQQKPISDGRLSVISDGEIVVFDDIAESWQNLRVTTDTSAGASTVSSTTPTRTAISVPGSKDERMQQQQHNSSEHDAKSSYKEHRRYMDRNYAITVETRHGIIEYEGSPRRFGQGGSCSTPEDETAHAAIQQATKNSNHSTASAASNSPQQYPARPGFPQRVLSPPRESTPPPLLQNNQISACKPQPQPNQQQQHQQYQYLQQQQQHQQQQQQPSPVDNNAEDTSNDVSEIGTLSDMTTPDVTSTAAPPANADNMVAVATTTILSTQTAANKCSNNAAASFSLPAKSSTFDYLYEFSETRKVLEEFFKCPSNDEKPIENGSDVDSIDIQYEFQSNLEREDDVDDEEADVDTQEDDEDEQLQQQLQLQLMQQQQEQQQQQQFNQQNHNNYNISHQRRHFTSSPLMRDFDFFLDSASRSSGEQIDQQDGINHNQLDARNNYRYSPETTDYDSNCGDLDSLSGELNGGVSTSCSNYAKYYASSMPVLEDGLSSGHTSDTENNNINNNLQQLNAIQHAPVGGGISMLMDMKRISTSNSINSIANTATTMATDTNSMEVNTTATKRNSISPNVLHDSYLRHTESPLNGLLEDSERDSMHLKRDACEPRDRELLGQSPSNNSNNKVFKNIDPDLDSLYSISVFQRPDMTQMTPPPPAPAPHRKPNALNAEPEILQPIPYKDLRSSTNTTSSATTATSSVASAISSTLNNRTKATQSNSNSQPPTARPNTQQQPPPIPDRSTTQTASPVMNSPVWVPRHLDNSASKSLLESSSENHSKNMSADEEEVDTDLETDRLLGHQRLDDQGYYDENKSWDRKSRSLLSKISPKQQHTSTKTRNGYNALLSTTPENPPPPPVPPKNSSKKLLDIGGSISSPEHSDKTPEKVTLDVQDCIITAMESPAGSVGSACGSLKKETGSSVISNNTGAQNGGGANTNSAGSNNTSGEKKVKKSKNKEGGAVLIEGVLFRARYLGSTQLVCEGQPTKSTRMMQAEEAVSRIKALAPDGDVQPSTEVDLFISTEKIMVLNTDLKEIMMDHALRTISYIADIGDLVVLMARRRFVPQDIDDAPKPNRTPKMICHVFESDEAQFIAQSIGQAFQVAYMEFLKANGIEDHSFVKEMDYQEVLNSQEIFGDELEIFAKKELQKEVVVPKAKGEILGVVIVESGWGSMLPTVVIANLMSTGAAARCGQLNIGDQLIAINGLSLVGLPLSTCQTYIKNTKNQTVVKFTVVPCAPVVEVKIKRPNTKYQLGFSVQNGVICSLLRGGIAERGGVRVGHRIIEINNQSVVAVPHEKIVNLLATSVGEILMKTMPTSMFRLLTGQENPIYI